MNTLNPYLGICPQIYIKSTNNNLQRFCCVDILTHVTKVCEQQVKNNVLLQHASLRY